MKINSFPGFPVVLGQSTAKNWESKNFPVNWGGQYKGKEKEPSIVLDAICEEELQIWHAFFELPGSRNHVNVLDHSPTMEKILSGFSVHSLYC